ncbi:MAG: ABC-F family ATP-binding cassette domain-containing protein [Candidatus Riflebacteria bacterium]|nr:ABC-F family ATP-binding cassette domain-containing protein [Candidatus Riflebacteria bacterium]
MGIIGRNGSGKTTLLRIIAGCETLDGGRVVLPSGSLVAYVPQNSVFEESLTVLDAVFEKGSEKMLRLRDYEAACLELESAGGDQKHLLERVSELGHQLEIHGGWELEANAKSVLHQLGLTDPTQRVGDLSGGLRKRLALARGLILRPDLLILDEPTNHLDSETIAWLEDYLANYTGALLLVTHDRYFLDRVVNVMLEIEKGRVQRFEGNYTHYLEKKEEQALQRETEAVKREGMIRRELAWLRQGAKARSTKQKAHVERAKALISGPKLETEKNLELAAPLARLGNKILEIENITKSFNEKVLIDKFSYKLKQGDRIGIIGPNGSGKTTLLEIIAGRIPPDSGTIEVGKTVIIGYFDQESRALEEDMRVVDYIRQTADNVKTADGGVISASSMLERFLFSSDQQFTPIGRLSGGERRRLYLLRLLMGAPNLLLLDEPTNDFDIATLVALENYLDSFAGCLIIATHDRFLLDRVVTQVFRIEEAGQLRGYIGNYSDLKDLQKKNNREKQIVQDKKNEKNSKQIENSPMGLNGPASTATPRKLNYKERRELEDLEKRISESESRKTELEKLLSVPAGDFKSITTLTTELEKLNKQLEQDMNRWTELAELT